MIWSHDSQTLVCIRITPPSFQNIKLWDLLLKILISKMWKAGWKSQFLKIGLDHAGLQIGELLEESEALILHIRTVCSENGRSLPLAV